MSAETHGNNFMPSPLLNPCSRGHWTCKGGMHFENENMIKKPNSWNKIILIFHTVIQIMDNKDSQLRSRSSLPCFNPR